MSQALALPFTAWSVGRRVAAGAFAAVVATALLCAAVYVSGVLFLLLSKADPRQARWSSITTYWQLYSHDTVLRQRLFTAMGMSGAGLLVILPGALIAAARPRRALHGDARFASAGEVARAGLMDSANNPETPSILIGRFKGRYLALPGQLSVMLSAPNSLRIVHFAFNSTQVSIPTAEASALVEEAKVAPLVLLRGRTDGTADTFAESRIAQARANAVRDYLVASGVDPARIRTTYQPSGDHLADNRNSQGRNLNRRVEIEVYRALPIAQQTAQQQP